MLEGYGYVIGTDSNRTESLPNYRSTENPQQRVNSNKKQHGTKGTTLQHTGVKFEKPRITPIPKHVSLAVIVPEADKVTEALRGFEMLQAQEQPGVQDRGKGSSIDKESSDGQRRHSLGGGGVGVLEGSLEMPNNGKH